MKRIVFLFSFILFFGVVVAVKAEAPQYLAALDAYRTKEQQYQVAYQQYLQLNTLASQEEAVIKTKDALISRATLINLYFSLVMDALKQTQGVELSAQATQLTALQTEIDNTSQHIKRVEGISDRIALETEAQAFSDREKSLVKVVYQTLSLMKIAKMQQALDQFQRPVMILTESLNASASSQLLLDKRRRGIDEINRKLDLVKLTITEATDEYVRVSLRQTFTKEDYATITSDLGSGYAALKLALSYAQELDK